MYNNKIKNKIRNEIKNKIVLLLHSSLQFNEMLTFSSSSFLNRVDKDTNKEARIYIQSLGRNTFITVSLDDKLIYNRSIGQFKVSNSKLKKKDKRRMMYIHSFLQSFNHYFFKTLTKKYNIKNVSFYLNCLPRIVNAILKDFSFKYYSRLYFSRKAHRKYIRFKNRRYLKNKKLFARLKIKKKFKKKLYLLDFIRKYRYNKFFSIRSINYLGKISYNGCRKKKKKI